MILSGIKNKHITDCGYCRFMIEDLSFSQLFLVSIDLASERRKRSINREREEKGQKLEREK